MKTYKIEIDTGFAGAIHTEEIEVEDDTTENELNELAETMLYEYVSVSYEEIKDEE